MLENMQLFYVENNSYDFKNSTVDDLPKTSVKYTDLETVQKCKPKE